ncbi:MAG TPA: DUF3047 domain-containing protein [Sedimenticola sp.]|nr:DUF3047 domain-containing protein [Sedimenticola sp.]
MSRNHPRRLIWLVSLISLSCFSNIQTARIDIGRFSQGDLGGWEEKSFSGHTSYGLVQGPRHRVLKARTSAAASGMLRETDIDLDETPFLNWSWKVDNIYQGNNERTKDGDDYPARIYVVVSGGLFFWKTRAINYVWSSNQAVGTVWDNAYTGNAKMVAVRSGDREAGRWFREKRNVRKDLEQLFGEGIARIHAVAIMSDSDDTGQSATAYYGDIFFSAQ